MTTLHGDSEEVKTKSASTIILNLEIIQHFHKRTERTLFTHTLPPTQKRTIKMLSKLNLFHVQVQ